MPRRRPHPARRTRRLAGALCATTYVAIAAAVGLHERRAAPDIETANPFDAAERRSATSTTTLTLDPAAFAYPIESTAPSIVIVPRPANPLRTATTTTFGLTPPSSAAAAVTSTSAPATSSEAPTTTNTPTTTIYIRGS